MMKRGSKSRRRCEYDVIANILNIAKEGATRTQIMYGANLSFTLLNKYLRILINNQLLEKQKNERGVVYVLRENGYRFLRSYYELQALYQNEIKKNTSKQNLEQP